MQMFYFLPMDIKTGLLEAKSTVLDIVQFVVNFIAVPVICAILGSLLVFNIAKAYKKHRGSETYGENLAGIFLLVLCIALVASSPVWLWTMVG